MENLLLIAAILLMVGVALAVAEIFVPSGGLLGVLAAGGFGLSIACAWIHETTWGVGTLAAVIVLVPIIVVVGFRVFPRTEIGRQMILSTPQSEASPSASKNAADFNGVAVGTQGRAGTDLRPSGTGLFGNDRFSVVTEGEWIERDTTICVVKVEGNRIVVEAVS